MIITKPKSKIQYLTFSLLPVVLLLALAGGFFAARGSFAPQPAPAGETPINPTIEDKWGVRVTQIGVTADSGLVDFRFMVIDPDKALAMLQDEKNLPVMTAEESGMIVNSTALMAHKHDLAAGRTYFLLYRNTKGAIKPGTAVTVTIGDLLLEHVVAK